MPRVTITVPDKTPQPYRFPLDRQVVMIGRGSENDIAIECGSISVRHAEMLRIEGGYELRDLGSTNGIKLDGRRSDTIALRHGATVRLGDVAFDFQLSDEERDALRREKVLDELPDRREVEMAPAAAESLAGRESAPHKHAAEPAGGGKGFTIFVGLLLFALLAFFAGLSVRHYRETGGWLFSAIQAKGKTLKAIHDAQAPPAPAAAPAEESPFAPTAPTTPDASVAPATPDASVAPATPDASVAPATPDASVAPTAPDASVAPTAPDASVAPATPDASVAPATPEAPVAPESPAAAPQ